MNVPSPLRTIPESRAARWELLSEMVSQWYPPITDADGYSNDELDSTASRLSLTLPAAFREWYQLCGRRKEIWSRQDNLIVPNELRINNGHLIFIVEHQAVVEWGSPVSFVSMDDPPVFVSSVDQANVWNRECESLSGFSLNWFAYNLKWSGVCRWLASGQVTEQIFSRIEAHYPRLAPAFRNWPGPSEFFGWRDIILEAHYDWEWLYVATRTEAAALEFRECLRSTPVDWDFCSDEWPPG